MRCFFFSSRRRHTRCSRDWSSDVCSSDLLPHPQLATPPPEERGRRRSGEAKPTFEVHYDEGLKVGYKWYDAANKPVLFPFGFGLSYTTFGYSGLRVSTGSETTIGLTVKNTGSRAGEAVAE